MTTKRILVAMDSSDNSEAAARWAADEVIATGADIVAVHALGLLERIGSLRVPSQHNRTQITWTFEHTWTAPLRRHGTEPRYVIRDGPPAQVILDVAAEVGADLIVVGSRGADRRAQLPLGSTSTQVVRHSTCPVVVIPPR